MEQPRPNMAQQIAQAAGDFARDWGGMMPTGLSVIQGGGTLVITLHGALSPAEKALASTPIGAAQVQQFHRELFASNAEELRADIKRITGVEVRDATAEATPVAGN